jgi:A/G-specific adenine glycosylase
MQIVLNILQWYQKNKRELPWRETNNPYFIWLSEVILQQTQEHQLVFLEISPITLQLV